MFKLIKIEGSGTHQPEPVRVPTADEIVYKSGCAYKMYDSRLLSLEGTDMPTHIAIESAKSGEKDELLCFRIQDNMVFEVPTHGTVSNYTFGKKYQVKTDSSGSGIGINDVSTSGSLMIINKNGLKKSGDTVYVRVTEESDV